MDQLTSLITKRLYFVQTRGGSNNGSKVWNEKLHSFEWVNDVRTVGTNKARVFIRDCFREWQKKYNKYNVDVWKNEYSFVREFVAFYENSSFFFLNG